MSKSVKKTANVHAMEAIQGALAIQRISSSYWDSCVLFAANKIGLFTLVDRSTLTAIQIAELYKADPAAMERFLNACVALKLMWKRGNKYGNSSLARRFLVKGKEWYQGHIVAHWADMLVAGHWQRLDEAALTGNPVTLSEHRSHDLNYAYGFGDGLYNWIFGMHEWAQAGHAQLLAHTVDLRNRRHLLDVGGGSGAYSVAFCRKNINLRATILDLPEVAKIAEAIIKNNALNSRISVQAGDLMSSPWGSPDAILLSNVLHMGDTDFCGSILDRAYCSLADKGILIVHEWLLNSDKTMPVLSSLFSLHMLARPGGETYSLGEMVERLKAAGFINVRRIRLPGLWSVVVGEK